MTTIRRTEPQVRTQTEPKVREQSSTTGTGAAKSTQETQKATNTAQTQATKDAFVATGGDAGKADPKAQVDAQMQRAGVPEDQRSRVNEHLKGLSGEALQREVNLLNNALASPNADRAVAAYDKLLGISKESKAAGERLTPEIRESLVMGVATSRTSDATGVEGILGVRQAEQAARALVGMPEDAYKQTTALLEKAGTGKDGLPVAKSDAAAERSLILKAVAARSDRLQDSWMDSAKRFIGFGDSTEANKAMKEIQGFADDVRGLNRTELIRTTTALDVEAANTSTVDPNDIRSNSDTVGNNDGLFQRWNDSCGPTTAQMTRAEADPVYARQLHKEGINNADPNSNSAKEQKEVLENNGGTAVSRLGLQARGKLGGQLDAAQKAGELTGEQRTAVNKYVTNQSLSAEEQKKADEGLAVLRKRDGGHPTAAEVDAMRSNAGKNGNGMVLDKALNSITGQSTHIDYKTQWVGNSGVTDDTLKSFDERLKNGQDVPIRVSNAGNTGGHFMMVSDVRGEGDNRRYLVSDPWSGKTAWLSAEEMKDPSKGAVDKNFGVGWDRITHYYTE
jgi:hypothetical protein